MTEKIKKEVLANVNKESVDFNDDTIEIISEKLNQLLDIPYINEELEGIIINAVVKILYTLIFNSGKVLFKI
jgi:hypothetical protein